MFTNSIISLLLLTVISAINVAAASKNITVTWVSEYHCVLRFMGKNFPCSLGENGITRNKIEGDGKTPVGAFKLRRAFFRNDKTSTQCYGLPAFLNCLPTEQNFGWVDDPLDSIYNQFVLLPYPASHENLFLNSSVYDLLAVVGYNDDPVIAFRGSAIFFHVASDNFGPTAGCISLLKENLIWVLSNVDESTWMIVQ